MLLSKLKRLNPTTLITHHPFSISRLGFCNTSNIITQKQQQQKQQDEETIKTWTTLLNSDLFFDHLLLDREKLVKPLNPNVVQTVITQNPTCELRKLFTFFRESCMLGSQNIESYLLFSKRCVETSKLKGARRILAIMARHRHPISDVLDAITSFGLSSDLFTLLIYAYRHKGQIDEAVYLLVNYKNGDCFPRSVCLDSLMKELLRQGKMDLFWKVYERMVEANVKFNCILYNNVIKGYVKIGKTEDAKRVLLEMKEKDCSPDLVTYNLIIGGFLKQGDVDEVFNLKNEMVAAGINVDAETFSCIIKGLCKLGEYKEAIKIVGGMKGDGVWPDDNCYYPIIRDLCKAKRTDEAWDLFAEMLDNDLKPNRCTFEALRSAYQSLATKNSVMMYLKDLIAHAILPDEDILTSLFEGPYVRENTSEVLSIMVNVLDDSIYRDNPRPYNELIQTLLRCGKINFAMGLLSEMHKKGLIPDCDTYSDLIFWFIDEGDEEKRNCYSTKCSKETFVQMMPLLVKC